MDKTPSLPSQSLSSKEAYTQGVARRVTSAAAGEVWGSGGMWETL